MQRSGVVVVIAVGALSTGCSVGCGQYAHQTGMTWDIPGDDDPPESIDDYTLHEACGTMKGSIGYKDLHEDGVAQIRFDGTHPNSHVAITLTSGIFIEVYFKLTDLQVGTTLTTEDMLGQSEIFDSSAKVLSMSGTYSAVAPLTEGRVEILDLKHDRFWESDAYRMRFDLTYGEPGESEYWYTASGEDWIAML